MSRLLVLGGSWFLGARVVSDAVASGWDVTTFRRGCSGRDVVGARSIRGDRTDPADLARVAAAGPWDAVVDTSGYVPANVGLVAQALAPVSQRYVFLSTVSVYSGWPTRPVTEQAELRPCSAGQPSEDGSPGDPGPARYGAFKAGCERAVLDHFDSSRAVFLRPGIITGPGEYVGRLPWWLRRIAQGGTVLAPGDPEATIAPADVRDVATFVLQAASGLPAGTYNLMGSPSSFGSFLDACREVTGSNAALDWITDESWLADRVGPWVELPLWHTQPAAWQVDDSRARANGYTTRLLAQTVAGVWQWLNQGDAPIEHPRAGLLGLAAEKEARVLAEWSARSATG